VAGSFKLAIGNVLNPPGLFSSSQFKISTFYNDVKIDFNDIFGFLSFQSPIASGLKNVIDPQVAGVSEAVPD
jgi:hypothetical protein